jgi:DNA-3-methyladenine glycosylase
MKPLDRAFFARATAEVARDLVGKVLLRRASRKPEVRARIVEVEAYLGQRDAASHARFGPTPRAAIMFGPPGRLYVYLVYGMHHCMNLVTEEDGVAGAVLIRAAELLRVTEAPEVASSGARPLSGPGKLCAGLGVTVADKGMDVTHAEARLLVYDDGHPAPTLVSSHRVGVAYAGAWSRRRLRFYARDSDQVSGPRRRR